MSNDELHNTIAAMESIKHSSVTHTNTRTNDELAVMMTNFKRILDEYTKELEYSSKPLKLEDIPDSIIDAYRKRSNNNSDNITLKDLDDAFLHHSCKPETTQDPTLKLTELKYFNNRQL